MRKIVLMFITVLTFQIGFGQILIYPEMKPGEEILLTGKKNNISGSLILPQNVQGGKVPVFIYISGSGDFSFRSHFHPQADYTFCKDLADLLLKRGYAVFFLEKRGINFAGGNWRKAGFNEYAEDVTEVIQYLKQRSEIDASQIGLMGHSQGGYIAQIVAAENPYDISLLINLVGPAQNVHQQVLFDLHNQYSCRGIEGSKLKFKMNILKFSLTAIKVSSRVIKPVFLSHVIRHDPAQYIQRIQCPILTVYAENDYMVDDIINTQLMTELLLNNKKKNEIHTITGVNHQFLNSGLCDNWDDIDKNVNPELFNLINNWLDNVSQSNSNTK